MSKENLKINRNIVGATISRPHFEAITKNNNGITLIALIITIIVMMILVAVSVAVALNGGLFDTAKYAGSQTQLKAEEEMLLSAVVGSINERAEVDFDKLDKNLPQGFTGEDGTYISSSGNTFTVDFNGKITSSSETINPDQPLGPSPEWIVATTKPSEWSDKVTAMTDGTNTIPLPNGFEISKEAKEDSIEEGLVIKDGINEFVWIPVENAESYQEDEFDSLTGILSDSGAAHDSYQSMQYFYKDSLGEINDEESFNEIFTYEDDETIIEENIQKYKGFYVGRYETTIDGTTIGVQRGKKVLRSDHEITERDANKRFFYRWWGLYKVQKDMYASNLSVGSLMISSKQWDAIMAYTGYGNVKRGNDTYTTKPDLSASAYATNKEQYDVSKNIYDLAGNVRECTLKAAEDDRRTYRGGFFDADISASFGWRYSSIKCFSRNRF